MADTPPVTVTVNPPATVTKKHVLWTVYVFLILCAITVGLIVWQFAGLTPQNWCDIAKAGDLKDPSACFNVLVRLLDLKDHVVIGLLGILGLVVVGLSVVVLQIFVRADIAGNHVNIGADHGNGGGSDDSDK